MSWPKYLRAPRHRPVSLATVLGTRYPEDTWFQAISCPSGWGLSVGGQGDTWPRLGKEAVARVEASWLADGPRDPDYAGPVLALLVADLDNPDHAPWTSEEAAAEAVRDLATYAHVVHATRGGLRVVWVLAHPIPLAYAQSYLHAWYQDPSGLDAHLPAAARPLVDRKVSDWTRGFRVPWCVRVEDDGTPAALPAWGDAPPPMALALERPPLGWWPASPIRHEVATLDTPLPEAPEAPRPPPAWRAYVRPDSVAGRAGEALQSGTPATVAGERNTGTWRIVSSLAAQLDRGDPAPNPAAIYAICRASVEAQGEPTLGALWAMAVRASRLEALSRATDAASRATEASILDAAATEAAELGPVVLQAGPSVWVRAPDGPTYRGPNSTTTARSLLRAHPIPLVDKSGGALKWDTLYQRHGQAVDRVEYAYTGSTEWDPVRAQLTTTAARYVAPPPERDPEVEAWLGALFGPAEGVALDWLATAFRLDLVTHPTAALYLEGEKGLGKGLLAACLAEPWGTGPTPLAAALGPRKATLLQSPIVLLDEGIELNRSGTAEFRTLLGERVHHIDEKYRAPVFLRGAVRVVIAANNPHALGIAEIDSIRDLDAIADRVLHVDVRPEARRHLGNTRDWVTDPDGGPGRAVRHLAWLAETRRVDLGSRWLVSGQRTAWHDRMLLRIPRYSDALEAVYHGLRTRPAPLWTRVEGSGVALRASALHAAWGRVGDAQRKPRLTDLARTLAALSEVAGVVSDRVLLSWCDAVGVDL